MSRVVTVFSTKGKSKTKITTDATTWSELKSLIRNEGYNMDNLQAVEGTNRTTLQHQDARLPEGDFTLFLRPVKTKSGLSGMEGKSFKELRQIIKEQGQDCKDYLESKSGKSWTQVGTEDLRNLLAGYNPANGVADVVQSVAESKSETMEEVQSEASPTSMDLVGQVESTLDQICEMESDSDNICDRVDMIKEELSGLKEDLEAIYSPEALAERKAEEERIKAEKEEDERLAREANDIFSKM